MKLLEDLKLKFPMKEVPPYGFCIVVPGAEFNPDNEANLFDQGYKCFDTFIDGKPVTLVRVVKAEKGSGEKTVYSPPIAPIAAKASAELPKRWSPEEDEVLVKLWNERVLIEKMTPSFPGRTEAVIRLRIQRLEKHGKIKKRKGRGRPKKAKEVASPVEIPVHKSVDTPVHTPVTLDKLASDVKGILDVLDVQGRVLDKLFCALLMQAVEVKQEKGDLSIPPGLWIHYANALLQEDKQYREKFRLKVEQLLEASA